ncbi:MAG: hypothetical protein GSR84_03540 [Desulfurococcales archaeon]|nr:hypothetical protein [Desulfurococcales archaeon]
MAREDLYQVIDSFKQLGVVPNADLGYYLLLAGFTMFAIIGVLGLTYFAAKAVKGLWEMTPGGLLKAMLAMSGIFIFVGLLLP